MHTEERKRKKMDWIEIKMEVSDRNAVEGISNMLAEMGTGGVMIEDPQAIADYAESGQWDAHEFSDELLQRKEIYIKSYLPQDENLMNRVEQIIIELNEIEIRLDLGPTRVTYKPVQEEDWANAWKVYFKPERIGKKTVIKPTWEQYKQQEGDLVIELDPGMAFGTGNHATTALCLQMLEEYVQPGMDIMDVGTGSGILAIQAGLLGAGSVQAMDYDTVAVSAATDNVALNHLQERVSVCQSDLLAQAQGQADLLVANIIADIIIRLTPEAGKYLKGPKIFISSGIIDTRKDDVLKALTQHGFSIIEVRENACWVAIAARYEG